MGEVLRRLRYYFQRRRFEAELDEEMEHHLAMKVEAHTGADAGEDSLDDGAVARRQFGNVAQLKEDSRAMWGWRLLENIVQDLRYGLRQLRLSPGFAAVAILSLALGAGANLAVFQLLNAVRLRALPVQHPEELVEIEIAGGNHGFGLNQGWNSLTYPVWEQIRDHQEPFAQVFAWAPREMEAGQGQGRHNVRGAWVSGEAFGVLGVRAERGRLLTTADDQPGCAGNAVVSYGFWQRELGGRGLAELDALVIHQRPVTVVGVTPPGFFGLEVGQGFDVALPFCAFTEWNLEQRNAFWLGVMGSLKPDWTVERAAAHLNAVSPAWFEAVAPSGYDAPSMEIWDNYRLTAEPRPNGISSLRSQYETSLWLLLGITGLVLLIGCANLANLMLVRAASRGREIAVRMAIGASRVRIVTQLLWESLLIAGAGAVAGAGLAVVLSRALVQFLSTQQNEIELDLPLDWRVISFAAAVALAACVVFGLSTALFATRGRSGPAANLGIRSPTVDRRGFSFQRLLVASQVALSLVLIVSALMFVESFRNLFTLDVGFRQEGILFTYVDFRPAGVAAERVKPLQGEILDAVGALPGIESVSTSTIIPLSGQGWSLALEIPDNGLEGSSRFTWVSPQYFATMEIPLLAGRDVNEFDTANSGKVLVVNETFARRYFGDASPIGRTVRSLEEPNYPETLYQIVGLVQDTMYSALRQEPQPIAYAPDLQHPSPAQASTIVTRSALPAPAVAEAIRAAVAGVNLGVRINANVDLRARIVSRMARERMLAWLAGFFGVLAAVLVAIGLYGIVSYMILGRRREIAIRLAMGATRGAIVWMLLRQMLILLGGGLAAGLLAARVLSGLAASLLFEMQPGDPVTLVSAGALLALIAIWASLTPARWASRIDPMAALRRD